MNLQNIMRPRLWNLYNIITTTFCWSKRLRFKEVEKHLSLHGKNGKVTMQGDMHTEMGRICGH